MHIRAEAQQSGRSLYCRPELADVFVAENVAMRQAIGWLRPAERTALMQWLTRIGPHWSGEERRHSDDDWFEVDGAVVTNSAIAEAAFCIGLGLPAEVVSFDPSDWLMSPLKVARRIGNDISSTIDLQNHWSVESIRDSLTQATPPTSSWEMLKDRVPASCPRLTFSDDAFEPLRGHPFNAVACERLELRLSMLNRFATCFDDDGRRNAEGHRIYEEHFTGEEAWFSDSSDSEIHKFKNELTFRHPDASSEKLFCPYHGKVKTAQLRIHFSWPITHDSPVYVVYVGPKLTKR